MKELNTILSAIYLFFSVPRGRVNAEVTDLMQSPGLGAERGGFPCGGFKDSGRRRHQKRSLRGRERRIWAGSGLCPLLAA